MIFPPLNLGTEASDGLPGLPSPLSTIAAAFQ